MGKTVTQSFNHSVFSIRYHVVFITKYRKNVFNRDIADKCRTVLSGTLSKWRCSLLEFGWEPDHVHMLIECHPTMDLSVLINNLKTVSSRKLRQTFADHFSVYYSKPVLWNRSYFVATVGDVSIDVIRNYVINQAEDGDDESQPLPSVKGGNYLF